MWNRGAAGGPLVNLTVHGVGDTPRPLDPGEDATWVSAAGLHTALDELVGRPDVRITVDDGNASDVEIVLPALLARGLRARFFVLAGLLGEPGRLDEAGVRELARAGMAIGSHGWAHRDWRGLGAAQVHDELQEAPRRLSALVGAPVTEVAVPFGSYDRRVLDRLRDVGVQRVFTSDGGRARSGRWLQPRTSLRHDTGPADVRRMVGATPPPAAVRRAAATWVKRHRGPTGC